MRIYDQIIQCTSRRYGSKTQETETSSESEDSTDSSSVTNDKITSCKYLSLAMLFSLYCQFYYLAVPNTGLFLTSIIHWRKPELGLRRTIDMGMTFVNFLMHAIHSFNINSMCFFVCMCGAILIFVLYFAGKRFSYNSYSTLCHLLIHTTGTMSALAIYYISKSNLIDHS
ncbi:hypothetical protein PCYB_011830 [Plasmodium cynomolgi strain B]|uniref:Uncharacterized protein n=1 Tax=Plasmodium cynomolgi (strain B) TaxID=1120755 RepID=K6URH4_PLACD|nr:hypothetical protein PCYB_011830 [Plasmodium cynomolgi strain B]GAB64450.1 hypothetical protein PCYB_011830 [Plasmodium cynomolgi strain B]